MPAWVVPAAIAAGGAILNMVQGWRARKINESYVRQQNEYNSPRQQMARYQQAGLNPHLIYGQGSPGLQSSTLSAPESMQRTGSDFVSAYNQSSLAQSQVAAQGAQKLRTEAMTEVNKLQAKVLQQNPYLNASYVQAVVESMIATANQKSSEARVSGTKADWFTGAKEFTIDGVRMHGPAGVLKMETELKALIQQFDLGSKDLKIKAEILQSKEFQNALSEIQLKWLKDGDITPQHIFTGIMLLLSKMF